MSKHTLTFEQAKITKGIWYPCYYERTHVETGRTIKDVVFCKNRHAFARWIEITSSYMFGPAATWKFLALNFDEGNPLTAFDVYQLNTAGQKAVEIDRKQTCII